MKDRIKVSYSDKGIFISYYKEGTLEQELYLDNYHLIKELLNYLVKYLLDKRIYKYFMYY